MKDTIKNKCIEFYKLLDKIDSLNLRADLPSKYRINSSKGNINDAKTKSFNIIIKGLINGQEGEKHYSLYIGHTTAFYGTEKVTAYKPSKAFKRYIKKHYSYSYVTSSHRLVGSENEWYSTNNDYDKSYIYNNDDYYFHKDNNKRILEYHKSFNRFKLIKDKLETVELYQANPVQEEFILRFLSLEIPLTLDEVKSLSEDYTNDINNKDYKQLEDMLTIFSDFVKETGN